MKQLHESDKQRGELKADLSEAAAFRGKATRLLWEKDPDRHEDFFIHHGVNQSGTIRMDGKSIHAVRVNGQMTQ